jgi:hypothetical protein
MDDAREFVKASAEYIKKYAYSRESAQAKLMELGLYDGAISVGRKVPPAQD